MPNRLANASSPYLLQHKDNPVDWHPWGEDAFEKARAHDRPLFLSIGYSTCHWCHVMEEESFEDDEVAAVLNAHFVPIKVDREERPDVDSIYMNVCQMMSGRGGWPLTVLLTPDRKPFFAGTYLPKRRRGQQMGLLDLLDKVSTLWETQRDDLLENADEITTLLQRSVDESGGTEAADASTLDDATRHLRRNHDAEHGGFGSAPKFPAPHNLLFLLREAHRTEQRVPREIAARTLDRMRLGGIYDHVGGGFHRYSTDRTWLLPHFEKMLYDQATHVLAYSEAYQATGRDTYAATVRDVLRYVRRDLQAPEGAFYSAEDADSLTPDGEREEGAFYVWTMDGLYDLLPEDQADLVADVYNCEPDGNYHDESTRAKTGANILHLQRPIAEIAAARDTDEGALRDHLADIRQTLLERRAERPRPGLDDKILTDWNGLMIAALATASRALRNETYAQMASDAAAFLLTTLRDGDERLLHRYREGDAAIRAHLDDYAMLTWGLLELYEATYEPRWLREALALTEACLEHFWDADAGGFFFTASDAEALIVRQKELYDGAQPSGNSVQFYNLLRLERLTGDVRYAKRADALARWAGRQVRSQPSGFTGFLLGTQFQYADAQEIVIAAPDAKAATPFTEELRDAYAPFAVSLLRTGATADALSDLAPFTDPQTPTDGQATAYVCRNHACDAPSTDPTDLRAALAERAPSA